MIVALIVGTLLAVGALAFVLYPLFFGVQSSPRPRVAPEAETGEHDAIGALREIEFDRATGKLSDVDYAELKARYTRDAVAAMRQETPRDAGADDEIEAAVRAFRASMAECRDCGLRPEPDAVYCSNCGRYLRDRCADCGAPVEELDARFCVSCGNRLLTAS
jgi:hypothetical protein